MLRAARENPLRLQALGFSPYLTTGDASSVDATTQLTLRITLATITGINSVASGVVSVVYSSCLPRGVVGSVCAAAPSTDDPTAEVVVYTVQLLANPLQGPPAAPSRPWLRLRQWPTAGAHCRR